MAQNTRTQALSDAGVSIWLDDLSRQRMDSGNLRELIDTRNVVGVTTNPSIFQSAISGRSEYDADIARLAGEGKDVDAIVEVLTTDDVRRAADLFADLHTATHGFDGRVSIEVDPRLAHSTEETIAQAKHLHEVVGRENLFVKIPATEAGLPAITATIAEGISVNVTLIFSVDRYRAVIDAYLAGLEQAAAAGKDLSSIHSVASFFVSRVDSEIDSRLEELASEEASALRGQAGVANAQVAFGVYLEAFAAERFAALKEKGANVQRALWASTGVKNPEYSDTLYVDSLVADPTVNTMPEKTLAAVAEHSQPQAALNAEKATSAEAVLERISEAGVDLADVFAVLEREGVEKFEKSWNELLATVSESVESARACSRAAVRERTIVTDSPSHLPGTDAPNPLRDPRDRRLPLIAGPGSMVMFGVTGDLARKKLLPAIYDLTHRGLLPPSFGLVGFGRREWSDDDFAEYVRKSVSEHSRTGFDESVFEQLRGGLRFVTGTFDDTAAFERLTEVVGELDRTRGTGGNHAFYLSIPPDAFPQVCGQLANSGLNTPRDGSWRRVVIEKPFGHDLASARELNDVVEKAFRPEDVFRIDHYLGKETVQNILALRFANQMFEPVWNASYVDHVQITMAEDIGIGSRAGYYDGIGTARDVIQNHLLQLLALTAMEEPVSFRAADLRAEKEKVLAAVELPEDLAAHTARGQYVGGWQGGEEVRPYLEEDGIPADSTTETFAAMRLDIATRRWAGVPFYLRAGKRLGRRVTEIAVVFKRAPFLPFRSTDTADLGQNAIVIRVQPDEGVTMRFGSKVPGTQMEVRDVTMDFAYGMNFTEESPEAYERLILDMLLGDPPLFPRQKEVELSWKILDPITAFWAENLDPAPYRPGTWGPDTAHEMLAHDGRTWRRP